MNSGTFEILQLRSDPELHYHQFAGLDLLRKLGLSVDKKNYACVYSGRLDSGKGLEDLYYAFNMERPEDFRGHSMSVSDIVVLRKNGEAKAYYCDSIGFTELPGFFTAANAQKTDIHDIRARAAGRRSDSGRQDPGPSREGSCR